MKNQIQEALEGQCCKCSGADNCSENGPWEKCEIGVALTALRTGKLVVVDGCRLRKLYSILRDMIVPKIDIKKWYNVRGYTNGAGTAYNKMGILQLRFTRIVKSGIAYLQGGQQ